MNDWSWDEAEVVLNRVDKVSASASFNSSEATEDEVRLTLLLNILVLI